MLAVLCCDRPGFGNKRNAERVGSFTIGLAAVVLVSLLLAGPVAGSTEAGLFEDRAGFGIRPEEGEVERLYLSVFGREPDTGGFDFWVVKRLEGWSLDRVADNFIDSPEYRRRFGDPSDTGFIDLLYRNVLDRSPDTGGRAFWLAQLDDGMRRRRVVLLFSESPEFVELTGTVPPPRADGRPPFEVVVSSVETADLGASWRPGCPVGAADLVHLDVRHIAADGGVGEGRLTVHRDVADDVVGFFAAMYARRFPITSIRPAEEFGGDDDAMMAVNNTSAFNCRAVVGGSGWSRHAFGRAIDINPLVNPYVRGSVILPPAGAEWSDRSRYEPGMVRAGGGVVDLVRERGWRWGGDWLTFKDYQHIDTAP